MKSWRAVLPIHPAAELFPLMSPAELKKLGEDIKQNGLRNPCRLIEDEDGQVVLIDGRNRLDALELIGEEIILNNSVIFERVPLDIDATALIISLNIHRRHLTIAQKDELITKLIKADPTRSNRQVAKMVDASHPHVAKVRKQAEKAGDVETVTTLVDTKGRKQPRRPPNRARATIERTMKLGEDTMNKIKGTSLDNAREFDELIKLNRGAAPR
jgi:ParB-like chromosome segregation protein Spo0J